jgi:hypothetical protein
MWIAFGKPHMTDPRKMCRPGYFGTEPDCMVELELQMMSLVITKATLQQFLEIALPWIVSFIKQLVARRKKQHHQTDSPGKNKALNSASLGTNRYVAESKLMPYASTMDDYTEMVIQFGFLSLFALSFPLTALVNLLNNLVRYGSMPIV